MKFKKITAVIAAVIAMSSFGACTDKDKQVQINPYWLENSLVFSAIDETLTYGVTFEPSSSISEMGYDIAYSNGAYTTNLKSLQEGGENIYTYTTELEIQVTYTYNGESADFVDRIYSETKFNETLKPISSVKTLVSHSPVNTNGGHKKVSDCYASYAYEVKTSYSGKDGASVVTNYADPENPKEVRNETFNASGGNYRYLDNEQLLFALRGVSNSTTSGKLRFYSPFVDELQIVKFKFDDETGAKFDYTENGTTVSKDITYRPVTLTLSAKNPGATQTAWIAKCTDAERNANRNILLRLETPLSYNMGKLVYKLNSVSR